MLVRFFAACLIAAPLYGACVETLAPYKTADLAWADYPRLQDVAWVNDDEVALATWHGISLYSIQHGRGSSLLPPDMLENVVRVASDGRGVVAANALYSFVAVEAGSGNLIAETNELPVRITDLALDNGRLTILGTPNERQHLPAALLYTGNLTQPIEKFTPVGPLDPQLAHTARQTLVMQGGSLAREPDGTVDIITPWRAGIQRARGTAMLSTLAPSMTQLEIPHVTDLLERYAKNFPARYTEILNRQNVADDIVRIDSGPAVVVRHVEAEHVHWSLWFVGNSGVQRKVDLTAEQAYAFGGHLRCDARGARLVCALLTLNKVGEPPAFNRLLLFDLHQVRRSGGCK